MHTHKFNIPHSITKIGGNYLTVIYKTEETLAQITGTGLVYKSEKLVKIS